MDVKEAMRKAISQQLSFGDGFIDPSLYQLDEELMKVDELLRVGKEPAMRTLRVAPACPLVAILLLAAGGALGREALLPVSAGALPTDTGSDGGTKFAIEERPELAGKALKVAFAPGDSFGDRMARISDWRIARRSR